MSTTLPPGRRTAGFSTIFWKIQGCDERRLILRRTRGRPLAGEAAGAGERGASDGVVMMFSDSHDAGNPFIIRKQHRGPHGAALVGRTFLSAGRPRAD